MNPGRVAYFIAILVVSIASVSSSARAQFTWKKVGSFPISGACGYFFDADHGMIGLGVRHTDGSIVPQCVILRTTDGGQNWLSCVVPTLEGDVTSIYMQDAKVGWASVIPLSDGNCLWRTTDGGLTWTAPFDSIDHSITSVYGRDSILVYTRWDGFYGNGISGVDYSTDSGHTWTTLPGNTRGNGVAFSDAMHGVVTEMNLTAGSHWYTSDGGRNWQETPDQNQYEAWSVYALAGKNIFFTANEGQIGDPGSGTGATPHQQVNWSTDGGLNWSPRAYFPHMQFTGTIAGKDSVLYFQTDTAQFDPADPATVRGMYRSTDLGLTWKYIGGPAHSRDSRFVVTGCSGEVVYAFDAEGNVWKTTDGGDGTVHAKADADVHIPSTTFSLHSTASDLCKPITQTIPFFTTGCGTASLDSIWFTGSPNFSTAGSAAIPHPFGSDSVLVQYQRSGLGASSDSAVLHIKYSTNGVSTTSDIPFIMTAPAIAPTSVVLPSRTVAIGAYSQSITLPLKAFLPQYVMDSLQQSGLATLSVSYGFDPSQLSYTFFASPATLATSSINQAAPGVLNVNYRNTGWSYSPGAFDLGNIQMTVQSRPGSEALITLRNLSIVTKNGGTIYPCLATQEDNQWQVVIQNTMSVGDETQSSLLRLSPSPFHDHILVANSQDRNISLTLCDLLGRELAHFDAASGESEWSNSQLRNGIYVIYWQENGRLHSVKLTKVE